MYTSLVVRSRAILLLYYYYPDTPSLPNPDRAALYATRAREVENLAMLLASDTAAGVDLSARRRINPLRRNGVYESSMGLV